MSENREIKGDFIVEIDPRGTKAHLVFSPDVNGEVLTEEKIREIVNTSFIKDHVNEKKIKNVMHAFRENNSGEPVRFLAAEAELPAGTINEKLSWKIINIPEELIKDAEEIYANAPLPVVYEINVTKIKVKEIVKKKASLPFMKPKEEEITRIVKQESKIEVAVDSIIKGRGYVDNGTVIAEIQFGRAGKPAINLYGKEIPPENPKKVKVYTGNGVRRRGAEVISTIPGFLRRGDDWADIIPFKQNQFRVYPKPDGTACFLDFTPGSVMAINVNEILDLAVEYGFNKQDLLQENELREILEHTIKSGEKIKAKNLCIPKDSLIDLEIKPNKLSAYLSIRKSRGEGKILSLKDIGSVISKAGLKGMNIAKVREDILEFYKGTAIELKRYLLVMGSAPIRGRDGEINFKVEYVPREEINSILVNLKARRLKKQGSISYGEFPIDAIDKLAYVDKGQKLAELSLPKSGTQGLDIYGSIIPGINGNDPDVKFLDNIHVSKNRVLSQITGLLEIGRKNRTIFLRVEPYKSTPYSIRVSEDNLKAFINIEPFAGSGNKTTSEIISVEMEKLKIIKGIKTEQLKKIIEKAQAGEVISDFLFAEGEPPVHASGSQLHFNFDVASGKSLYIRSSSGMDKGKKNSIANKGDLIAEIIPSEKKSKDGWDIFGNIFVAKQGLPINIEVGNNIRKQEEANSRICFYAEKKGEIFYDGVLLEIKDDLQINGNVNVKTGNIKFSGTVKIIGSVDSGVSVFSGGDIKIGGSVGGALLSSDGSIYINGGIRGENKAILRAKGNVLASFIESTTVLAVGNVKVKNSCHHCTIKCNSKLFLNLEKSDLVGGEIKSKKGLELYNIGSERKIRTNVSFGQDYLVSDQIELEMREIEKLKKRIMQYDLLMFEIEKGKRSNISIDKVRKEKLYVLKLIEKRGVRLFNLREKFEEHVPSEIIIRGTLYPGVVFESHGRYYEVTSKKMNIKVYFDLEIGKIIEKPL